MDDNTSKLFMFLVAFWTLLAIFSAVFANDLNQQKLGETPSYLTKDAEVISFRQTFWEKIGIAIDDTIGNIPVIQHLAPLLKILTFSYTDQVPALMSIFLNMLVVLTAFVGYELIKN